MKGKFSRSLVGGLALALGLAASGAALGHGWDAGGKGLMRGAGPRAGVVCNPAQRQAMRALYLSQRGVRACPYAQVGATPGALPGTGTWSPGPFCPFRPGGSGTNAGQSG